MIKRSHLAALLASIVAAIGVTVAIDLGGDEQPEIQIVFGQPLLESGQDAYAELKEDAAEEHPHTGLGDATVDTPPPGDVDVEEVARLLEENQEVAEDTTAGPAHPLPLASAEPKRRVEHLVRNYSSRRGARPAIFTMHDTESPNVPGIQDLRAVGAWFNNPRASASSHYGVDAEGNVVEWVPETAKAWTQAFFNPWSVSIEMIGYASQLSWPEPQLRASARLVAASTARWGIPVRKALVSGCTIVRSGILQHRDLGGCGGGHHDAGANFPIDRFIRMVAEYRKGGVKVARYKIAVADWRFGRWYLGLGEYKKVGGRAKARRPVGYPAKTPPSGWRAVEWYLARPVAA